MADEKKVAEKPAGKGTGPSAAAGKEKAQDEKAVALEARVAALEERVDFLDPRVGP